MTVVDSIVKHEGFRETPYPDPLTGGAPWTFGHGLTYITQEESRLIVERRVREISTRLQANKPFFVDLPAPVRNVLIEMAFQLGLKGVLNFSRMWGALKRHDYVAAADEMLDSRWAEQTPSRAEALAKIVGEQDE
jgi:lysozyme